MAVPVALIAGVYFAPQIRTAAVAAWPVVRPAVRAAQAALTELCCGRRSAAAKVRVIPSLSATFGVPRDTATEDAEGPEQDSVHDTEQDAAEAERDAEQDAAEALLQLASAGPHSEGHYTNAVTPDAMGPPDVKAEATATPSDDQ